MCCVADGKIVGDVIILGEYDVRNDIMNDSQKVMCFSCYYNSKCACVYR